MAPDARGTIRGLGRADLLLLGAVALWLGWVLASRLWSGEVVRRDSYYLVSPILLLVGVALGRIVGPLGRRWRVAEVVTLLGVVALVAPLYANAQGAIGVQLVGLAALIALTAGQDLGGRQVVWLRVVVAVSVVVGVLLAIRSDAAALLVLLLIACCVPVVGFGRAPTKKVVTAASVVLLAWAAAGVAWLGSLTTWPGWLNSSLSWARHELWGDALTLWRAHPITGGGPGSFVASSELASSEPSLAMTHSSVLQIGSELGLVGVGLFTLVVVGGIGVAASGSRRAAAVAVTAWTFLGIHSVIDHLWEFPAVVLIAGGVLGWAASTREIERARPVDSAG